MVKQDNIIIQELGLATLIHREDWTEIIFEEALFSKFENENHLGTEPHWILYEYCKNEFFNQGKAEKVSNGFKILAKEITSIELEEAQDVFSIPNPLEGTLEIKSTGLNASSKDYKIQIRFVEKNSRVAMPYQTAGCILKSRGKLFFLNSKLEEAFRIYRQYESLSNHSENEHYHLAGAFKSIKNEHISVIENRFKSLDISEVLKVGLNITKLDSGDLQLEPNLIGSKTKNETAVRRELNYLTQEGTPSTLHVGRELIQIKEEAAIGIQEIRKQSLIKKEVVGDFLNNPGSFINANKVDIETGFSFRVQGIIEFTRIQHVDIEPGNNDWFLSNAPITLENFEAYIHNESELEDFEKKVEEAREANSENVFFDERQFKIPPKEEFEWRIKEKRKELSQTSLNLIEPIDQKTPKTQVGFDIKYFKENKRIIDLYKVHELEPNTLDGLSIQPFEHQREAIQWIYSLYRCSLDTNRKIRGGILADDMGLGKTFSSLMGMKAIIEYARNYDRKEIMSNSKKLEKCFMVVAPLSLVKNWKNEVSKFFDKSPFTDVVVLNAQADLNRFRFQKGDERKQFLDKDDPKNKSNLKYCLKIGASFQDERLDIPGRLILITYETLRNYQFSMGKIPFSCVVFDEAQKIKNPNSLATKAAKALISDINIMATGTPVENNLKEYWCLMDTANGELLGSPKDFDDRYIQPLKNSEDELMKLEVGKELYKASGPFLLRRTKEELKDKLGKSLPDKLEYKGLSSEGFHYLSSLDKPMTKEQISAYEQIRKNRLEDPNLGSTLQNLYRIRSCILHPRLTFKKTTDHMLNLSSEEFWKESAKLMSLFEILKSVKEKQEKLIIFVISRSIQYLIKKWIKIEFGVNPDIVSGETKVESHNFEETRLGMIEKFSEQEGFNTIILSPLAAGVGLNVTAANHVFHLERHWNPAKEAQANDRAYRIGQDKEVSIYYPIGKHPKAQSFDVKLDKLLSRKTFTKDALITYPRMTEQQFAEQNLDNLL